MGNKASSSKLPKELQESFDLGKTKGSLNLNGKLDGTIPAQFLELKYASKIKELHLANCNLASLPEELS